jgi:hypothetical protein
VEGGLSIGCANESGTRFCLLEESKAGEPDEAGCGVGASASECAQLLFAVLALAELEPPTFVSPSSSVVCAESSEEEKKTRQTAQISRSKVHLLFALSNADKP